MKYIRKYRIIKVKHEKVMATEVRKDDWGELKDDNK